MSAYRNVLIVCGGRGDRWNNYLGVPKQLAPIEGEPLLARTVRQVRARGLIPAVVAQPHDNRFNVAGAAVAWAEPSPDLGGAARYWDSRDVWSLRSRTVILHGDVWFSDEALERILTFDDGWTCFARLNANRLTHKPTGELFGVSFSPADIGDFERAILRAAQLWQEGVISRCIGFEIWRAMQGLPDAEVRGSTPYRNVGRCVEIDDWTDDLDRPHDYERFTRARAGLDCSPAAIRQAMRARVSQ